MCAICIEDIDESDVKYVYDLIAEAEKRSFTVCEFCGAPAKLSKWGYNVETVCDEHRISRR